ncbi:hypothetical protein LBMAG53_11720 [Planctomycetota bacterium]|nr:hypothetical protein LBMAG53_11720 [Planctomycetota bacterium]
MSEPVLVAVPPKGGSLDDVLKRLVGCGWLRPEPVLALRRLLKEDKRRVKLEEGLIALWPEAGATVEGTLRAADRFGHDLDEVDLALRRMRRWRDDHGRDHLDYSPWAVVEALLTGLRSEGDQQIREAAGHLHLQLDLTRPGRPARMVFNQAEFERSRGNGLTPVRGVLIGTDHEVTPTWLRKHKRDLSLTCHDAFHNTLLDAIATPGLIRNWRELRDHLDERQTPVRILGSLGLDDHLGHCVLMAGADAERARRLIGGGASRTWDAANPLVDPKLALFTGRPVLIDPAYAELYASCLATERHGLRLVPGPKDIERACAEDGQLGIYIVRSGSTVALMPGLCVIGEELLTSETIVAVNHDRMERNPGIRILADSLEPSQEDHTAAWRARLRKRLGDRLV